MFGPFGSEDAAIKQFKSKFKDKTKNNCNEYIFGSSLEITMTVYLSWIGDDRANFKKVAGKYDLIDVAGDGDEEEEEESTKPKSDTVQDKDGVVYAASKLDAPTQSLIRLIFDTDMFKDALRTYDIDVKKMPLGKLSKAQIAKGFEILEELEAVMENKKKGSYADISSKFYTCIPHDFGRQRPRPIDTREALQQKYDMLAVSDTKIKGQLVDRDCGATRFLLISNWHKVFKRIKMKKSRRRKSKNWNHIRMMSIMVCWNVAWNWSTRIAMNSK